MTRPDPIPEGYHTVTPHLVVSNANEAIEFYKKAFGAVEILRIPAPDGKKIMHAELKIGDSPIMLCDEFDACATKSPKTLGASPVSLHLYVEDVDKAFDRVLMAGAMVTMALNDTFWGDRYGQIVDPFGHEWSLATRIKIINPDEMQMACAGAKK